MDSPQQEPTETDGSPTIETGMRQFIEYKLTVRG